MRWKKEKRVSKPRKTRFIAKEKRVVRSDPERATLFFIGKLKEQGLFPALSMPIFLTLILRNTLLLFYSVPLQISMTLF